ncbi:MAG: hypothetical protein Kow0037_17600 [Calditrichia bacterium]
MYSTLVWVNNIPQEGLIEHIPGFIKEITSVEELDSEQAALLITDTITFSQQILPEHENEKERFSRLGVLIIVPEGDEVDFSIPDNVQIFDFLYEPFTCNEFKTRYKRLAGWLEKNPLKSESPSNLLSEILHFSENDIPIFRFNEKGDILWANSAFWKRVDGPAETFKEVLAHLESEFFERLIGRLRTSQLVQVDFALPRGSVYRWSCFKGEMLGFREEHFVAIGDKREVTAPVWDSVRDTIAHFKNALKNAPIGLFKQNRELRYTWAFNRHPVFESEDIIGKTDEELLPPETAAQVLPIKRQVLETGESAYGEIHAHIDGREAYFNIYVEPNFNKNNQIVGISCVCIEVTALKIAEQKLRKEEQRYRTLYENSTLGIYRTTPEGRVILANPAMLDMLGYESMEELSKINVSSLFAFTYNRNQFLERIERDGEIRGVEFAWKRKDGTVIFVRESSRAIRDENGNTLYYDGVVEDISDLKRTEAALRESENRYRSIFNNSAVGIFRTTPKGEILLANAFIIEMLGYDSLEELRTRNIAETGYDEPFSRDQFIEKINKDGEVIGWESKWKRKDGTVIWVRESARAVYDDDGNIAYFDGVVEDITEKKIAESRLVESEEKFRSVFEHTGTATILVGRDGKITLANRECEALFGYPVNKLIGACWEDFVPVESRQRFREGFEEQFNPQTRATGSYEVQIVCADGSFKNCILSIGLIPSMEQLVISLLDLTERVMAEKGRRLLESAMEHSAEIVFLTDRESRIIYVNRIFEEFYGYKKSEVYGQKVSMLRSYHHEDSFYKEMMKTLLAGSPWKGYLFNRKKDGEQVEVYATIAPIFGDDGEISHFVTVQRDVSREREIERRSQQSQRLEAIGTLAGGIAHDFNNILTPILGYAEMCMKSVPKGSQLYGDLSYIHQAASRARDLVKQILTFSRQTDKERKPILVTPIIKEALKLIRASLPSTVQIISNFEDSDVHILADPTEIHQVIMNLCTNAYQAMPEGGKIVVKQEKISLESGSGLEEPPLKQGEYVKITISDTGKGIPPEILDKIFEPYFTTKADDGGTGLGLATVHGIVTNCGGAVTVNSQVGKGTDFHLYFPLCAVDQKEEEPQESVVSGGQEFIWLVDDEPSIAKLAAGILSNHGYQVRYFTNPQQLLNELSHTSETINLILTDLTMPGITGIHLLEEVKKVRPDLPVVLCTGYRDRIKAGEAEEIGFKALILKPFTPKSLAKVIRSVLDEAKTPSP